MPATQTAPTDQAPASRIPDLRDRPLSEADAAATAAIRRRIVRRAGTVLPVAAFQSAL